MKFIMVLGIFALITYVSALSGPQVVYDGPTYELKAIDDDDNVEAGSETTSELTPVRERRVTCDVLSWQSKWFSFNHSACAMRCLAQRRKGGRCSNGVCVCRN